MQKQIAALIVVLFVIIFASVGGVFFIIYNHWQAADIKVEQNPVIRETPIVKEALEPEDSTDLEVIASEVEKVVKGIYINEFVANSQTPTAKIYRDNIKKLLQETELNAVVIDIKENAGPDLPNSLKAFISELHQKDVWVIARICAFRDSSLREEKPEWYLKDSTATSVDNIWKDAAGASWLDASSTEAQAYLIDFSKKAIDFGFDELQFDYIRFPSDGNLKNIVYPFYSGETEKYEVIGGFFSKLSHDLREYKSSIILSADLFGYLATRFQAFDIGQRLGDAGKYFDYLSFMLYPSHFYGGFSVPEDSRRQLPVTYFPYKDETTTSTVNLVSNNPYPVIMRSVLSSVDYLSSYGLVAKVRPWLQDFNLSYDVARGIFYDAEKVKVQIQGAEDGGSAGWLLWNSANIYTENALKKIEE